MSSPHPGLSFVVPVHNNAQDLDLCLSALQVAAVPGSEIIVVDDHSTEEIRAVAAAKGATFVRLDRNSGPSSARNAGAREATGDILFFVDSDVVIAPDAVTRLLAVFARDPTIDAVFGSYDNRPRARGVVSQYRNLLHHYVHQTGSTEASTFWAGCGAVRRAVFEAVGGFDEGRFARCMEDIELGYRLRQTGSRIVMDKAIQGTHLKRWTLRSVIRTDVYCRAIPWTRLILERRNLTADLNLKASQRASVALVGLACLFLLLAPIRLSALAVSGAAIIGVIVLNRGLYAFFVRERGLFFAAAAVPLHLLYFFYSGFTYVCVWCDHRLRSLPLLQLLFKQTRP